MNLSKILEDFRIFLCNTWRFIPVDIRDNEGYELDDWFQANWELLVETRLQQNVNEVVRLPFFGNGADSNGSSSRILFPNDVVTHTIKVNDTYTFSSFGGVIENGWFEQTFPFDHVQLLDSNEDEVVFPISEVTYSLVRSEGLNGG